MFRFFVFFSFLFFCLTANAQTVEYHSVKPKKGDGVLSLLRRYHLEHNACNVVTFYDLNGMRKGAGLKGHIRYKLPVKLYTYNGKSIRTTIKNDDLAKAKRIQKYNERLKREGLRKTSFINSKILWVPLHELDCDKNVPQKAVADVPKPTKKDSTKTEPKKQTQKPATKPKTSKPKTKYIGTKTVKLFGKHRKVNIIDNKLKGQVYYIVSGHGGPDPGAQCKGCPTTLCEDEYAYDIGLRLARDLMQHGALVHVIVQDKNDGIRDAKYLKCDKDERVNGQKMPINQRRRLNQRAAYINKLYRKYKKQGYKKQAAVFLHIDSNSASMRRDVFFYHHKNSKSGKKLCKKVMKTFKEKYNKYQPNRGYAGHISSRGLYVLNYTQPTCIFIELANIRNKKDHKRFVLPSNRQIVAEWLAEGLTRK